jgi:hypothetical protein
MKKYQVIGGQYESHWYGESDSLHGAKVIAGKNKEYRDNWGGWHTPSIYDVKDVEEIVSKGRITSNDGVLIRVPKEFAEPIAFQNEGGTASE